MSIEKPDPPMNPPNILALPDDKSKYRPVLSLSDIQLIISHLPADSAESLKLCRYLTMFVLKGQHGLVSHAYKIAPVRVPKYSPAGLGFEASPNPSDNLKHPTPEEIAQLESLLSNIPSDSDSSDSNI